MSQKQIKPNILQIIQNEREIVLLGTAHILDDSVQEVRHWIEEWQPDMVYVELCEARYRALTSKDRWKNLDIVSVIKSGQGFLMLASLFLTALQKKMGIQLGEEVGEDMLSAIRLAQEKGIPFVLADRDLNITLKRTWQQASLKDKMRIVEIFFENLFEQERVSEEEVKNLLSEGNLYNTMMTELAKYLPAVKKVLLDERNLYMAKKVLTNGGKRVLVVLGRGHLEGVADALENPQSISLDDSLDTVSQSRGRGSLIGWLILLTFIVLMVVGFV
ncbi:MAG: TraB family protein, partial [Brevinematales bacterium]